VKVLLIGASGPTGQQLLAHLGDHDVTALVRSARAIPGATAVRGDARNADDLERAVRGQDAVISALGSKKVGPDDLQASFLTGITTGMTASGVPRLITLSPWGTSASRATAPLLLRMGHATILRNQTADREVGERVVDASGLSYTHVRAGVLSGGAERGGVIGTADGRGIHLVISRADLAAFMVRQLTDDTWARRDVIVGYAKR
jgi:uncharacterized protein YbjT (DUF2867 family)